jgi:hypothetical protein
MGTGMVGTATGSIGTSGSGFSGHEVGRGEQHLQQPLKEVDRVRALFPETWLWTNVSIG